jgi:pimeloyl-ACP methyl ester carboxylesterase
MQRPLVRTSRRFVALASVSLMVTTALAVPAQATSDEAQHRPRRGGGGTNGATVPTPDWKPCGTIGALCATVSVPLDYDDPKGPAIQLSVSKLPAADPAQRIGSVFWNSGGPGGPAAQDVRDGADKIFSDELRNRFDVIGIDPRGVGDSTPIRCFTNADERAELLGRAPEVPTSSEEIHALLEVGRAYTEKCAANAGPLLRHVSTANVARDMDLMRQAVGDAQLTYFGVSYGTHLGSVYANLFPDKVRALALDGNLDAVAWSTGRGNEARRTPFDTRVQSAAGSKATLEGFLAECERAGAPACALADGDPFAKWDELLERLRTAPIVLPAPDGTTVTVTYSNFVGLVFGALYAPPDLWPNLALGIQGIYEGRNMGEAVTMMRQTARMARERVGFAADDPFDDSFVAVTCSETANPTNPKAWVRNARREARDFGPAGEVWAWDSVPCATWTAQDEDRYTGPWDRPTANPILLVNNFFDPATSFESATNLLEQLNNAQLLPVSGYGHVAFGSSTCASQAIDRYLVDLRLPPDDVLCRQDIVPFEAPAPVPVPAEPAPPVPAPVPVPAG